MPRWQQRTKLVSWSWPCRWVRRAVQCKTPWRCAARIMMLLQLGKAPVTFAESSAVSATHRKHRYRAPATGDGQAPLLLTVQSCETGVLLDPSLCTIQEQTATKETVELQISIVSNERDTLQAETQTLRARLSELADVQQEFAALQVHDAAVSARLSVVEEEHAVSVPVCVTHSCGSCWCCAKQGHGRNAASSSRR